MAALSSRVSVSPSADLTPLQSLVAADMVAVDGCIAEAAGSYAALIPTVTAHLTRAGGKRLRPMLTLAAAAMCGYQGQQHIPLATAVEFIHTATLLHDDVVDESVLRRGRPTANATWGNPASVLVGDYLFAQSFRLMVATGSLTVLDVLSRAAAVIVEGEVLQLQACQQLGTGEAAYRRIIAAKTAALFAAACEVSAVIAETPHYRAALHDFGHHLGLAFQLMDDLLDYRGDQTRLGKTIGDDFREGKVTLPMIHAYAHATPSQQQQWEAWFAAGAVRDTAALAQATEWITKTGGFAATKAAAQAHGDEALAALAKLPSSVYGKALAEAVAFCLSRGY